MKHIYGKNAALTTQTTGCININKPCFCGKDLEWAGNNVFGNNKTARGVLSQHKGHCTSIQKVKDLNDWRKNNRLATTLYSRTNSNSKLIDYVKYNKNNAFGQKMKKYIGQAQPDGKVKEFVP